MTYTTPSKYHYTVEEQRDRLPLYLREFYETRQLDRITIDGNEIQGYFEYSFIEEKTYVKSPERSADGTIDNLNSYATFMTPRLVIKYNYMHIEDYRTLMKLLNSKNEFIVECYDIVRDERVVHKMYHAPAEMPKIHQRYLEVLGVRDYTVELIGTNASLDTVEIRYYDENGVIIPKAIHTAIKGIDAMIYYDYAAIKEGYRFEGTWKDKNGAIWHNGDIVFMNGDLDLYAEVVPTSVYKLSFDYGNGVIPYNATNGQPVDSVDIVKGDRIGFAIRKANITLSSSSKFEFPAFGTGANSEGYKFRGWYFTPFPQDKDAKVVYDTLYDFDYNRTIYQIYDPIVFTISFDTSTALIEIEPMQVKYNDTVYLPTPKMNGFNFLGWYDVLGNTFASGSKMPAKSFSLVAKWEKNG